MTFREGTARTRTGVRPYIPQNELTNQAMLDKLKMPASMCYGWDNMELVITDKDHGTETRWRVKYRARQLALEQMGAPKQYGKPLPTDDWKGFGLWRPHATAVVVLTRHHSEELLAHIGQ